MNDTLFTTAGIASITGWLALGFGAWLPAGRGRAALLALGGRVIPLGLCLLYAGLLWRHWGSAPGGGFSSLAGVQALFLVPGKALGAWVHFLAFDLLVGRWITDELLASGWSRAWLLPALPATFLYGPLGVLVYLLARAAPALSGRARGALAARR